MSIRRVPVNVVCAGILLCLLCSVQAVAREKVILDTERYHRKPNLRPAPQHAVAFIIAQVKKYPGEITIAALGPCTNLALAVREAPKIVPMIRRSIHMGGSFFKPGNVTPAAEFKGI